MKKTTSTRYPLLSAIATVAATALILLTTSTTQAGTWVKRSSLLDTTTCATGYIPVPTYTLPDATTVPSFCVMKYEAKKSSRVPADRTVTGTNAAYAVSSATEPPWVNVTWTDAKTACAATGASLITENQWLSLAHQTTNVASNWSGGAVGNGSLYSGHNDNSPAAALEADPIDTNGYANTGNSSGNQRRTLTLPNGQVIWDLAGNVWEWTDASIAAASRYHGGAAGWMSYNITDGMAVATAAPLAKRPPSNYNANQGMGRYYDGDTTAGAYNSYSEAPDNCTSYCAPAAFLRGGSWTGGSISGVFALNLGNGRSYAITNVGFRCTR